MGRIRIFEKHVFSIVLLLALSGLPCPAAASTYQKTAEFRLEENARTGLNLFGGPGWWLGKTLNLTVLDLVLGLEYRFKKGLIVFFNGRYDFASDTSSASYGGTTQHVALGLGLGGAIKAGLDQDIRLSVMANYFILHENTHFCEDPCVSTRVYYKAIILHGIEAIARFSLTRFVTSRFAVGFYIEGGGGWRSQMKRIKTEETWRRYFSSMPDDAPIYSFALGLIFLGNILPTN